MKFVLCGQVVTMNEASQIIPDGAVYVDGNLIVAVSDRNAPAPEGFVSEATVSTNGIIFPGLVELHNHLSYDALPMWQIPKKFKDRGEWQNNTEYISSVSAPMMTLAKSKDPHVLAALARYVETKCLMGGVTTSQGISLKGDNVETYYRSTMRIVEDPTDAELPKANTHIPDVAASDWAKFNDELSKSSCLLLHLSEGLDAKARDAFLALQNGDQWAITPALAGIHCAALEPQDFVIMASKGASMIWSPLSNLLLYGGTSDVKAARSTGVSLGLGSDWSPTGSKNLLNELKVAKVVSSVLGLALSDKELLTMATSAPANIVKWNKFIGSIEAGKRADFAVIAAAPTADPYSSILNARETDIVLVLIDGRAVAGTQALMSVFGQQGETIRLGSESRVVNYGAGDPRVPKLTFAEAQVALADALIRLPTLLDDETTGRGVLGNSLSLAPQSKTTLRLALDEEHCGNFALRPNLPLNGKATGPDSERLQLHVAKVALHPKAIKLDALTVVDDPDYGALLQGQKNISPEIKDGLKAFYE